MEQRIAHITLVVDDYDEAINFYTQRLRFILVEDTIISETKRWVLLAPPGTPSLHSSMTCLLLAKAATKEQQSRIGDQTGGRVFLFLYTDDFWRDYRNMSESGISFVRKPVVETYGTVAVFEDLYGNRWDLIEHSKKSK